MRQTRPAIIDLQKFVPQTKEQAAQLFVALVALNDVSDGQARSIIGTLQTLPDRSIPALSPTLVRYRKILAPLEVPPWEIEATPS